MDPPIDTQLQDSAGNGCERQARDPSSIRAAWPRCCKGSPRDLVADMRSDLLKRCAATERRTICPRVSWPARLENRSCSRSRLQGAGMKERFSRNIKQVVGAVGSRRGSLALYPRVRHPNYKLGCRCCITGAMTP